MPKASLEKHFVSLSKDTFIYGLGNAATKVLLLIATPILTRVFVPADYGVISLISSVTSFISLILIFGMDTAAQLYYWQYNKDRKVIPSGFWFLLGWGLFITLIASLLATKFSLLFFHSQSYRLLFLFAFWTAIFTLLFNYFQTIFRLEFKAKIFVAAAILNAILVLGLTIVAVVYLKKGLQGYFMAALIGNVLSFGLVLFFLRKNFFTGFSLARLKEMVTYGALLVPSSIAYFTFDLSDRFFINRYHNLTELGLYSIAISISSLMIFFSTAFSQAWTPFVVRIYFESRKIYEKFVGRIFVFYLIFFAFLGLSITLFGPELLRIFTTSKFYDANRAILPLAVAMIFSASTLVTPLGITIGKKTKYLALCALVAALLNTGTNFLLIPKYGMVGASWSTAITYLFLTSSYLFFSQKFIYVKFDWKKIFKIIILTVFSFLILPHVLRFGFGINLILKIGSLAVFLALVYLMGIIEKDEFSSIKRFVKLKFKSLNAKFF